MHVFAMAAGAGFDIDDEVVLAFPMSLAHLGLRYSQMTVGAKEALLGMTGVGEEVGFLVVTCLAHFLNVTFLEARRVGIVAAHTGQLFLSVGADFPLGVGVNMARATQSRGDVGRHDRLRVFP
jgi:hypothetical protein